MGADIKSLRTRIKSVSSTLQLTKAMGLVASSKIRKAQLVRTRAIEYSDSLASIVDVLTSSRECQKSPYLKMGEGVSEIVVIAGDRGLAGGYNANIFRFLREMENIEITPVGKKACERFTAEIISSEHFSHSDALLMATRLCNDFKEGKCARVGVVYTKYVSMISQVPDIKWILPLEKKEEQKTGGAVAIFEPDEASMLEKSVPLYVAGLLYACVKESFACEVVARRSAMDSAGKNATSMIDELMLKYNRARQGTITQEITEIVAGSGEGEN
ncbi:MAG: ATP synthase F1 subunit gamma [Clostridia bacterium]|nr:ATP synthase F1 subunit gamma [Clostridia bacterium]